MIATEIFEISKWYIIIVLCILEAQMSLLMLPEPTAVGGQSCLFFHERQWLKDVKGKHCGFPEVYIATDSCTCTSQTSSASTSVKKIFQLCDF